MNKAVFLDRDGTINKDKHYLYKVEDFEFLPGVMEALRLLYESDYLLIIITNQSGIARGYYSEQDYLALEKWLENKLVANGSPITASYYCPHLPDAEISEYRKECNCRKPKLGMFQQAVDDWNIDLNQSYAIGDRIRDCRISEESGCKGILIGNTESNDVIDYIKLHFNNKIIYKSNLLEAAKYILTIKNSKSN